jgi:hypothetical protein
MVAVIFSGMATKLSSLDSHLVLSVLSYTSFVRWFAELVYIREVFTKSIAWRMPSEFYKKQSHYSALYGVLAYGYTPQTIVFGLDLCVLFLLGLVFRVFAYWALVLVDREMRGLRNLSDILMPFTLCSSARAAVFKIDLKSFFTLKKEAPSQLGLLLDQSNERRKEPLSTSLSQVESYEPLGAGARVAAETEAWNRRSGRGTVRVYSGSEPRG